MSRNLTVGQFSQTVASNFAGPQGTVTGRDFSQRINYPAAQQLLERHAHGNPEAWGQIKNIIGACETANLGDKIFYDPRTYDGLRDLDYLFDWIWDNLKIQDDELSSQELKSRPEMTKEFFDEMQKQNEQSRSLRVTGYAFKILDEAFRLAKSTGRNDPWIFPMFKDIHRRYSESIDQELYQIIPTDIKCKGCKKKTVTVRTTQKRSADEGVTSIYTCQSCNWRSQIS